MKAVNYYLKIIREFQTVDIVWVRQEYFCSPMNQWFVEGELLYSELSQERLIPKSAIATGIKNGTIIVSKKLFPPPNPNDLRAGQRYIPMLKIPPLQK